MYQKLKEEIREIIAIVEQCPDALKEKCFELLLENYLDSTKNVQRHKTENTPVPSPQEALPQNSNDGEGKSEDIAADDDICEKDFHVKVLKLLKDNGITMKMINGLYYKENGCLMPFYETLKSTSMQECQMRLAVLTAFENSFNNTSGDMTFDCESIRNRCQTMKCYNATNFTGYFKSNKDLWETWPDKYDKSFIVTLSPEGKKKLTEVLTDLSEGL